MNNLKQYIVDLFIAASPNSPSYTSLILDRLGTVAATPAVDITLVNASIIIWLVRIGLNTYLSRCTT